MKIIALTLLLALGAAAVQDTPQPGAPGAQHEWLQQLVGEWEGTSTMEPGSEPAGFEGTERVRSFGDLWIVAEGSATVGGTAFSSLLTLGYDPAKEAFVGTWIDTLQTHMWSYVGKLDEAQKTLTLETEGPSFEDPSKTSSYRDTLELKSADHKVLSSSVRGADGTWTTFMRIEYRRTK